MNNAALSICVNVSFYFSRRRFARSQAEVIESCFLIQAGHLCLLIGVVRPFAVNIIIMVIRSVFCLFSVLPLLCFSLISLSCLLFD